MGSRSIRAKFNKCMSGLVMVMFVRVNKPVRGALLNSEPRTNTPAHLKSIEPEQTFRRSSREDDARYPDPVLMGLVIGLAIGLAIGFIVGKFSDL